MCQFRTLKEIELRKRSIRMEGDQEEHERQVVKRLMLVLIVLTLVALGYGAAGAIATQRIDGARAGALSQPAAHGLK